MAENKNNQNQNQGNENRGGQNQGNQGQENRKQGGGDPQGKVNLNDASREELMNRLEGVGDSTADDIIKYREENGGFKNMDELRNVYGVDDEMEEKIRKFSRI